MRRNIYVAIAGVLLLIVFWAVYKHSRHIDAGISAPTLAPGDQEKLILDPARHTITTIERSGPVRKTFLPPHVTSITVDKSGKVTVHSRTWGTEAGPFLGFAYSDKARLVVGVNLLYWHSLEGSLALTPTVSGPFSIRVALLLGYNVYSNTSLFVGVDHTRTPVCGIAVKF